MPAGTAATFIGPGRTAAVINLGPGRSSAFFTYRTPDPAAELKRGPVTALREAFGDLGGGVPDALRQLDADTAYFDSVSQVVLDRWSHGRVVLLGDAAWCVTLFAGYGAAMALAGADQLASALKDNDIPTGLAHWETGLRPEILKRQALARRGISQFVPPTRMHVFARDLAIRATMLPGIRTLVARAAQR